MANTSSTHNLIINISSKSNTQPINETAREMDQLTGKTRQQHKETEKAPSAWNKFGSVASGALLGIGGSLKDTGGKLQGFGAKHRLLAVGVVAGGVKMAKSSNDYNLTLKQTALMSDDVALASMTNEEAMAYLDNTVEGLGKTFKTFSKQEIADQFYEIAKSGYSGEDATNLLSASLMLASATGEDVNTMTDVMVSTLTSFGLEAESAADAAQSLANAANASRMDVGDMLTALNLVGSVAANAGMSIEETANTIGFLRQNGMNASTASTGLRTALSSLTAPSDAITSRFDELGVSLYDTEGNFRGMNTIMGEYSDATAGASEEQKNLDAKLIAGKTGANAWKIMTKEGGEEMARFSEKVNEGALSLEEIQAELDAQDKWGQLQANLADSSLALAEQLAPAIEGAMAFLIDFLEKINSDEEFANQVGMIVKGIAAFALFTQAVGLVGTIMTVVGGVAQGLGFIIALLSGEFAIGAAIAGGFATVTTFLSGVMGVLLGPVGLVIALIGGLVFVFVQAYKGSEEFRDKVNGAVKKVADFIKPAVDFMKEHFGFLGEKFEAVGKVFTAIGDAIKGVWEGLKGAFKKGSKASADSMDKMSKDSAKSTKEIETNTTKDMEKVLAETEKLTAETSSAATTNYEEMAAAMEGSTGDIASTTGQDMSGMAKEVEKATAEAKNASEKNVSGMGKQMSQETNAAMMAVRKSGEVMVESWSASMRNMSSATDFVKNIPSTIQNALTFSLFNQGQSAMYSFANGLNSGLSYVYSAVNAASSAKNNMSFAGVYSVGDGGETQSTMAMNPISSVISNVTSKFSGKSSGSDKPVDNGGGSSSNKVDITVIQEWDGESVKTYVTDEQDKDKVRIRTIKRKR